MKSLLKNRWIRGISPLVALCFLTGQLAFWFPTPAQAGSAEDLKKIEYKYYFRGDYERAIQELRTFLERKDLSAEQVVEAREYLAASLIMTGATAQGQAQFTKLLQADREYAGPDPSVFKAAIVSAFDDAKAEYASSVIRTVPESAMPAGDGGTGGAVASEGKPIYKKWWFYVTMGAVVLVIAAAAGGNSEDNPAPASTGSVSVDVDVR